MPSHTDCYTNNDSEDDVVTLQINGKNVTNNTLFDVTNPATDRTIWQCCSASTEDAEAAVNSAQTAFSSWSKTKPAFRRNILFKAAEIFEERADELRRVLVAETGAQVAMFDHLNLPLTVEMMRDCAGRISSVTTGSTPITAKEGSHAMVLKVPYGVVLGIAPWNVPYILGMRSVLYAIAAGNTAILKGPELAPRTAWLIGDVFRQAGLPAGVLNVLFHRPQDAALITNTLIAHPYVKKINFTGSTAVGSIISSVAGKYLKPVLMELGGKASAIVLADADLDKAAKACMVGAFANSGQICMSTERIVVHHDIAGDFSAKLKAQIEGGANTEVPILISSAAVRRTNKLVRQALDQGATLLTGECGSERTESTRLRPTVIGNVTKEMDLFHQETFGPSVSIIVVHNEDEAIKVANDTEYGLTAAVFTRNLGTGFRVASQINSGAVHINSMTVHDEVALPHGGWQKSGFGRFNADAGLDEFLQTKTVTWQDD